MQIPHTFKHRVLIPVLICKELGSHHIWTLQRMEVMGQAVTPESGEVTAYGEVSQDQLYGSRSHWSHKLVIKHN
jgi:hypothetical protein